MLISIFRNMKKTIMSEKRKTQQEIEEIQSFLKENPHSKKK